jgi:hypothetical protein
MSETRSVVSLRVALAHFSELRGNGFNPMVTELSYPFATSPLRANHLAAIALTDPCLSGSVRDPSRSL